MYPSLFQKLVFVILLHRSFIICGSIAKRALKNPKTVLGHAYCFFGDEEKNIYPVDYHTIHTVPLQDLRTIDAKPDLEAHGFTYVSNRPVAGIENTGELSDEHLEALKADAVELVKKLTGAKLALPHGATFRDYTSIYTRKPIPVIHSDLSPLGAKYMKDRVQENFLKSANPDEVQFGRYLKKGQDVVMLNVWRPIHTVEDNHLGFCEWNSLVKEDALKWNIQPTDAGNALQAWKYRKGQRWYYLSNQRSDEAFIFKQHDDSAPDGHGINVPHAAFNFESTGPFTRMSFEAKIIAILDPPEGLLSRWIKHIKSVVGKFRWNALKNVKERNLEQDFKPPGGFIESLV
ncbi:hypothetical protein DFH28DRAFT_2905 [Melampsora americana]|nr:hypothetical protein DFH28DRAFT_2905 [Melampsora americana]